MAVHERPRDRLFGLFVGWFGWLVVIIGEGVCVHVYMHRQHTHTSKIQKHPTRTHHHAGGRGPVVEAVGGEGALADVLVQVFFRHRPLCLRGKEGVGKKDV